MSKRLKRVLSLLTALVLVFSLAACGQTEQQDPGGGGTQEPPAADTPETPAEDPTTLMVGYSFFSQKFSPFFSKTAYDTDAWEMVHMYLLDNDRAGNVILNGIEGETVNFNGTDYFYDGPADIEVVQNEDETVDYNITLREDLVFSDGTPITIDDVIFNMYVYADPSYEGSGTFYSLPITGMTNYRTGVTADIYDKYQAMGQAIFEAGADNTSFSGWTEEQQTAFWDTYMAEGGEKFAAEIVNYCVANYGASLVDVYNDEVALGMTMWGYGEVDDAGVLTAPSGATFDLAGGVFPTNADYWAEIVANYGDNYSPADGINLETAGTMVETFAIDAFVSGEGPKDADAGGAITNISGIVKTGDYSCTVTTDYFEATSIYQFAFAIAPLHYYGDVSLYDYDNDSFGFPKGDLSVVREKTTAPMGAGAYKFVSYENGVISYEANENYRKGEPKIKFIRFQEVTEGDKLTGVSAGSLDITDPSFSMEIADAVKGYNSNGELTGDMITTVGVDVLGYGYIGINATNVNVGGDPGGDASKSLRAAFATLYAVYRDTVINSYYGDQAAVIQYPITNTSWAAPRPNDEGYRLAYSVDAEGSDIYTDTMTEAERYEAALAAATGFFIDAGYTFDEASGQFTAAPAGAEMSYEVIIPGDGEGNHPVYGILTEVQNALATIGINLEINDPADSNELWTSIESGENEMWCAAWQATVDPDMYQVYHSTNIVGGGGTESNHYGLVDTDLDGLILEARQSADQTFRKATYRQCLDIIMDWAVEIPTYQRQEVFIFSSERVNLDTVTPDITTFWNWMKDIELMELAA